LLLFSSFAVSLLLFRTVFVTLFFFAFLTLFSFVSLCFVLLYFPSLPSAFQLCAQIQSTIQ
jgi:hypothetical protein